MPFKYGDRVAENHYLDHRRLFGLVSVIRQDWFGTKVP
jgi:hypothetical protein